MADSKKNILKAFESLKPEQKRKVIIGLLVSVFLVTAVVGYKSRNKSNVPVQATVKKEQDITLEPKLLNESLIEEQRKALRENDEELKKLRERVDSLEKERQPQGQSGKGNEGKGFPPNAALPPIPGSSIANKDNKAAERTFPGAVRGQSEPVLPERANTAGSSGPAAPYGYPPPPVPSQTQRQQKSTADSLKKQETVMLGDIEDVTNPQSEKKSDKADGKKKAGEKIYLPPSFMEATLLSGLAAQTTDAGKDNPTPVILRIAAPAVLPNDVKMQLKGCFMIGEGHGRLSTERVEIRIISMSCLARDGKAVIDQKVKGFVVDEDGAIGLAGHVVTKMGAMLSRSLLAGFFQGLGDGFKASAQTLTLTAAGPATSYNTNDIIKGAAGSGVAEAAHDLQKFYLDLAKSVLPVIEVGAAKKVTAVISEGVDLDVKAHCDRSNSLGGACTQSE